MHKSFKLNPDYSASLSKEVLFKGVPVEKHSSKNWRIEEIQEHSPLGAKSSSVLL